jgi:hypothetical protein
MRQMSGLLYFIRTGRGKHMERTPGLHTSYTFVGQWGSIFQWHVEDCLLGAVNYLHFGKPKIWYIVPVQ